MVFFSVAGH